MSENETRTDLTPDAAQPETTEKDEPSADANDRRRFLKTGLTALAAGTGAVAIGLASDRQNVKSKILARIQEEMDSEYLNDPLAYHSGGYSEYVSGS